MRFSSSSTACGGFFSPSAVKCSFEGSCDDRDLSLGKMGRVTDVQNVLSLAWLNMWDQTAGTLHHGLSLCLCGPWYVVSSCHTQNKGYVPITAISCTAWTRGFWLMEWKSSKNWKWLHFSCTDIFIFLALQKGPLLSSGKISNGWNKTRYIFSLRKSPFEYNTPV